MFSDLLKVYVKKKFGNERLRHPECPCLGVFRAKNKVPQTGWLVNNGNAFLPGLEAKKSKIEGLQIQ